MNIESAETTHYLPSLATPPKIYMPQLAADASAVKSSLPDAVQQPGAFFDSQGSSDWSSPHHGARTGQTVNLFA
ncbi:MAG: hypothetical protein EOL87_11925 [Spartobacteria bacterium]|nr:hypothetical protein [Spartobacteria bacterium]